MVVVVVVAVAGAVMGVTTRFTRTGSTTIADCFVLFGVVSCLVLALLVAFVVVVVVGF